MNSKSLDPTPAEICTAIEVLQKLGIRIDAETTHEVVQLPKTELGAHYMDGIERKAFAQSVQVDAVVARLKCWRDELSRAPVSTGLNSFWPGLVPVASLMDRITKLVFWAEDRAAAKASSLDRSHAATMLFKKPGYFAVKFLKNAGSFKKSNG